MSTRTLSRRPAGFTLIELLVVISIIAILMALTGAAVQKVRDKGKQLQVVSEIGQLDVALNAFKSKMNVREIACRGNGATALPANIGTFVLRSNYGEPGGTIDFTNTFEYKFLKQVFPAADLGNGTNASFNNGLPNAVELDSAQLLVFWLGGYYLDTTVAASPVQVFGQGFNADSRFPFISAGQPASKKGPLYEFPASRLVPSATVANATGGLCPRYMDPWGTPYCFFATEGGRDNNYAQRTSPTAQVVSFDWNSTRAVPLLVKSNQYASQKGHQIFSAGKNKAFPFTAAQTAPALWTPGGGSFTDNGLGGDDFTNFNPTVLAVQP